MYLKGMVAGAARVDLDGKAAGEVTARDAEYAAAKLAEILTSREAKRAAVGATIKGAATRVATSYLFPQAEHPSLHNSSFAAAAPPAA